MRLNKKYVPAVVAVALLITIGLSVGLYYLFKPKYVPIKPLPDPPTPPPSIPVFPEPYQFKMGLDCTTMCNRYSTTQQQLSDCMNNCKSGNLSNMEAECVTLYGAATCKIPCKTSGKPCTDCWNKVNDDCQVVTTSLPINKPISVLPDPSDFLPLKTPLKPVPSMPLNKVFKLGLDCPAMCHNYATETGVTVDECLTACANAKTDKELTDQCFSLYSIAVCGKYKNPAYSKCINDAMKDYCQVLN